MADELNIDELITDLANTEAPKSRKKSTPAPEPEPPAPVAAAPEPPAPEPEEGMKMVAIQPPPERRSTIITVEERVVSAPTPYISPQTLAEQEAGRRVLARYAQYAPPTQPTE